MIHNNRFRLFILATLSILLLSCGTTKSALEKAEKAQLYDNKFENLDFKFMADYAYPQSFQSVYLSPLYDVTVTPDTVTAYLPYYGRAYRAPMNSSEGGIKFESTDFDSAVEKGRKDGEWLVTIRTNDTSRPFTLYFYLWNNGSARLDVNDQDRQSISFKGTIETKDIKK
jgi:hypothetical protein